MTDNSIFQLLIASFIIVGPVLQMLVQRTDVAAEEDDTDQASNG